MMICGFELTGIDWTNQDVSRIVEFFNKKFDAQNEEIARLGDTLTQKDKTLAEKDDTIA